MLKKELIKVVKPAVEEVLERKNELFYHERLKTDYF